MPKVTWAQDPREVRAKSMRTLINMKCAERDIRNQSDLARKIGMGISTLNHKMRTGTWTCEDIQRIDRFLRFSTDEIARLVRA